MTIASLVNQLIGLINLVVPIIIGLTLVAFIWRAAMSIGTAGSANEKTKVKLHTFLLWGVGAIFIMVSIWGILNILSGIFFSGGATSSPNSSYTSNSLGTSCVNGLNSFGPC